MRVIGIDASKAATGWAVFDGALLASGVARCPAKRTPGVAGIEAAYTGAIAEWLRMTVVGLLRTHGVTHACLEEPLTSHAAAGGNDAAIHLSHTVFAAAAGACVAVGVPVWSVNQGTWRKDVGVRWPKRGAPDRSGAFKAEAMRICSWHGHAPRRHDEAEATLIARWLYGQLDPAFSAAATPLFRGVPEDLRARA